MERRETETKETEKGVMEKVESENLGNGKREIKERKIGNARKTEMENWETKKMGRNFR